MVLCEVMHHHVSKETFRDIRETLMAEYKGRINSDDGEIPARSRGERKMSAKHPEGRQSTKQPHCVGLT